MLTEIANGRCSDRLRYLLTTASLVPLHKDEKGGIRPLSLRDVMYRLCASLLVEHDQQAVIDACGPRQFGTLPAGPEAVVHGVQAAVDRKEPTAVIHTDLKNAYGEASKAAMLGSMFEQPGLAHIHRLADWMYAKPHVAIAVDFTGRVQCKVVVETGVGQGDPIGSVMHDNSARPDHELIVEGVGDGCDVLALHDDMYVIVPPAKIPLAVEVVKRVVARREATLQIEKNEVIYTHPDPLPPEVLQYIEANRMKLSTESAEVAGGIVSKATPAGTAAFTSLADSHDRFFARLAHPQLPVIASTIIARASALPRLNHALRTTLPATTQQGAQRFDLRLREVVGQKQDEPPDSPAWVQNALPLSAGGQGLRSQASVAPFAYLASAAKCSKHLARAGITFSPRQLTEIDAVIRSVRTRLATHKETHRERKRAGSESLFPDKESKGLDVLLPQIGEDFQSFYTSQPELADGLQRRLTHFMVDAPVLESLLADPAHQQRLSLLAQPHASRFLSSTSQALVLRDADARAAIKLRNGRPANRVSPTSCGSCHKSISPPGTHFLDCPRQIATAGRTRHDDIVRVLEDEISLAGGTATIELSGLDPAGSNKRPDLDVVLGAESFLVDVTVRDSTAQSYGTLERAFAAARSSKHARYDDMSRRLGCKVIPFMVDAYGALSTEAVDFVNLIADYASDALQAEPAQRIASRILDRVSCVLQRGNARMLMRGILHSLRNHPQSRPLPVVPIASRLLPAG